jgi:hypothetical protein
MARQKRRDERSIPAHPYRDTALVYGFMAVLLVAVAWVTGGDALRAMLVALVFFVVATAWSWWKFRGRISRRDAAASSLPADLGDGPHPEDSGTGSAT